jgi:hypothetical protein
VAAARMSGRALAAHPPVGAPLMQLLAASACSTGHTTDEGDFLVTSTRKNYYKGLIEKSKKHF